MTTRSGGILTVRGRYCVALYLFIYLLLSSSSSCSGSKASPADAPVWNLQRHFNYSSFDDAQIEKDVEAAAERAAAFRSKYDGLLPREDEAKAATADAMDLKGALQEAIVEYEAIAELKAKTYVYLQLLQSIDQTNDELTKKFSIIKTKLSSAEAEHLVFFQLMLGNAPENYLTPKEIENYEAFVRQCRRRRPHLLSLDVEKALTVRAPFEGADPVTDYYEKQLAKSKFFVEGGEGDKSLSLEEILTQTFCSDQQKRIRALKGVNSGLEANYVTSFAALSFNVVAGAWHIDSKERNYPALRSQRNLDNEVSDDVVDALLTAVRTRGVELNKRYYTLKKKLLKQYTPLKEFTWADRNAPLPLSEDDRKYTWEEAVAIVRKGYSKFSSKMTGLFEDMLAEERVHATVVPGKRSGAYCHGASPSIGPFQFHNYLGSTRDVATLAHETGHGCHDLLAYKQGMLQYHPPLTLAETASIFGEMVVFRDLLDGCTDDRARLQLLMQKLDDVVNSVVRQCSFDRFEQLVHESRAGGTVADSDFTKFWRQAMREYYGEEGEIFDSYADTDNLWAYITHFHAVPFYVYAYAFADLVVGALYGVYKRQPEGFEPKLLELLGHGGVKEFGEALSPFGLDAAAPSFWAECLDAHLGSLLKDAEDTAARLMAE
eukprot:GHVU01154449.1.p1 GENE.GHVU01154449.1~~GHVU01154449.1.p1  ORF type:complete len:659 (-),score=167.71 GHVU01154449.1:554-2530(-)